MALLAVAVGPLITGSRCDVRMGVGASGAGARRGRPRGTAVVGGVEPPMLEAHAALVSALRGLNFDNTAVRTLAVDPQLGGPVRQVRGAHVVRVEPTRLKSPELVATSEALGLLGLPLGSGGAEAADAGDDADADADAALLDPERLPLAIRSDLAAYLSGNEQLPGAEPFAAAYCGHQFGRFAGQLGDGAVISLGEIVSCGGGDDRGSCDAVGSELLGGEEEGSGGEEGCGGEGPAGEEAAGGTEQDGAVAAGGGRLGESAGGEGGSEGRWELQLKGAGPTPFSRAADGRKVLRSSIRELLASEAMHALRLPTTRAAALVSSDARVSRDAGNNGQLREERCAVLARVARSFLRFGSFELCLNETDGREGPSAGMTEEVLAPLFEYALQRHYPHLCSLPSRTQRVADFVAEVARRTAQLVAGWQTVGFVHGVLNTDNMAITGDTIDYGPFGFVDHFDPDYSPNDSDAAGRYSYRQQPAVSAWNLRRLASALAPLRSEGGAAEAAAEAEAAFWVEYEREVRRRWRSKLGLLLIDEGEADDALLESLLGVMQRTGADFTNTFRALSRVGWEASEAASYRAPQDFDAVLEYCLAQCASTEAMLKRARPIFHPKALARLAAIAQTEPERLAQFGLDASVVARETQRAARREALARVTPRDKRLSDAEAWRAWLHAYRLRLWRERRAVAGADDEDTPATAAALEAAAARRRAVMGASNPRFVLRQHIAARVIERAEAGDYVELRRVQRLLAKPYDDQGHALAERYASLPPDWSHDLVLT